MHVNQLKLWQSSNGDCKMWKEKKFKNWFSEILFRIVSKHGVLLSSFDGNVVCYIILHLHVILYINVLWGRKKDTVYPQARIWLVWVFKENNSRYIS